MKRSKLKADAYFWYDESGCYGVVHNKRRFRKLHVTINWGDGIHSGVWLSPNETQLLQKPQFAPFYEFGDRKPRCAHPKSAERDGALNAKDNLPATDDGASCDLTDRQPGF